MSRIGTLICNFGIQVVTYVLIVSFMVFILGAAFWIFFWILSALFGSFIWNFGIRVGTFVLFGCFVVLIFGIVARLFIFEAARKTSSHKEADPDPSAAPAQPSGPVAAA